MSGGLESGSPWGARLVVVRILDFSERGQGRKTELVEACDFMGIKPKNSSWNHGFHG